MVAFYNWIGDKRENDDKFFITMMASDGPTLGNAHSFATTLVDLNQLGYNFDVCSQVGNCHVDDARNQLVSRFLASDCTHLVFVDSDIVFDCRALVELLECDEPICGASYPYKDGSGDFPGTVSGISYNDDRGYVPIDGLPTGFMKISRSVFEALSDRDDCPAYYAKTSPGEIVHEFFNRTIYQNVRQGGDINFCRKAKDAGFQIWLLPKIVLGHTGNRTVTGCWWFKQSCGEHGVYPSLRDAINEDRWDNDQVLSTVLKQWDNTSYTGDHSLIMSVMSAVGQAPEGDVLEFGSGLTTLFLSTTGRLVTSLEDDRMYLGKVWGALDDFGPRYCNNVTLVHAQLKDGLYQAPKEVWEKEYAVCLVDGPALAKGGKRAQCLDVNSKTFIIDDCNRAENIDVLEKLEAKGYKTKLLPLSGRYVAVAWL